MSLYIKTPNKVRNGGGKNLDSIMAYGGFWNVMSSWFHYQTSPNYANWRFVIARRLCAAVQCFPSR